jgi:DNA invertase Pin-like site-specific DNA recombinase
MLFRLLAVMAEFERDLISERTKMAMAHKRSRHEHTGGNVPYGYKIVGHGLEQDPDEQRAITVAMEMRVLGITLRDIGKKLTEMGFKTRKGGAWTASTLQGILGRKA